MARQQARVGLADEADAERVDEAVERDPPARLDRALQVLGLPRAPAGQLAQPRQALRVRGQAEDVGRLADQPRLEQLRHLLAPEPLDVERVAADEVAQPLGDLGGADQAAGAAPHRLALGPQREAAADRAVVGEDVGLGAGRAPLAPDLDHLRDDVAGALHDHGVADPDVLGLDVVLVVEGRAASPRRRRR